MQSQVRDDALRFTVGDTLGVYRLEELIGVGGMGEVYKAQDLRLGRTVAIKLLKRSSIVRDDDDERLRFKREAKAIASLEHPNICTLHDVGEERGVPYLVMEFLEGSTLASRLAAGPLSIEATVKHGLEITAAVVAAHRKHIVHRDLKPANIVLTKSSGAKLLDFGVAKLLRSSETSTTTRDLTGDGQLVGTFRYMAPEVLSGQEADERSDLFALGCVLFEMACGQPAFNGQMPAQIITAVLDDRRPPLLSSLRADVPPALDQIVQACLAKDPDDRWQDARDLMQQLDWLAKGHQHTPLPVAVLPATRRRQRRIIWGIATAALAVAIAASMATLFRQQEVPLPAPHLTAVPCDAPPEAVDAATLCDGLTDLLVRRLAGLTVSQPIQVTTLGEAVRRGVRTPDAARTSIGATRVLAATLRPESDHFNLEYRLLDPRSGDTVDRQTFSMAESKVFEEQDRIVAWLVRILALNVTHPERESLVAHHTSDPQAYESYLLGRGALKTRRDRGFADRALSALARATERDPAFADAHANYGFAAWGQFEQTRDTSWSDRALSACDRALALDARFAEGHACRGQVLHGLGRHAEAAAALEAAVAADPTHDDAIVWLGREQEDLRDFAAAERTYRRAVEKRPGYWTAHGWLGNFFRRQGRFEEAVEAYEKVVRLIPDGARAFAVLGVPSMYTGQYEKAIAAFERSVAVEPTPEAYANWGITLYRMRRFDESAKMLERARTLSPKEQGIAGNLARAYQLAGKRREAADLYEQAITLASAELQSPGRKPALHLALADYHARVGRRADALEHMRQVGIDPHDPTRPTDPHLIFSAALVYHQLGDRAAALAWLERAVYWGVPTAELQAFPELDDLRNDPAFQGLVRQNGRRGL